MRKLSEIKGEEIATMIIPITTPTARPIRPLLAALSAIKNPAAATNIITAKDIASHKNRLIENTNVFL